MTPERWERIATIFAAVVDLDCAARGPLLDSHCGGDADLRAEVESLVAADARAASADSLARSVEAVARDLGR